MIPVFFKLFKLYPSISLSLSFCDSSSTFIICFINKSNSSGVLDFIKSHKCIPFSSDNCTNLLNQSIPKFFLFNKYFCKSSIEPKINSFCLLISS